MNMQRIALIMTIIVTTVLLCVGLAGAFIKLDFATPVHGRIEPRRTFFVTVAQAGHVSEIAGQGDVLEGDYLLSIESAALEQELGILTQSIHRLEQEIAREAPPLGSPRRRFDLGQQLAAKRRDVLRIRTQLANRHVFAPFDGRVVASHAHPGEWVRPSDEVVVVLVDESSWCFEAEVAPEVIRDVSVGAAARIRVAAYPYRTYGPLDATVSGIELTQDAGGAPAYKMKLRIEGEPAFPLLMGQRATALISTFHGTVFQYFASRD